MWRQLHRLREGPGWQVGLERHGPLEGMGLGGSRREELRRSGRRSGWSQVVGAVTGCCSKALSRAWPELTWGDLERNIRYIPKVKSNWRPCGVVWGLLLVHL